MSHFIRDVIQMFAEIRVNCWRCVVKFEQIV